MDIIKEMEDYAIAYNIPIMQGEGIDFMCNVIKEKQIKRILEIGAAIGYSAIRMAMLDEDIEVVTMERDVKRYDLAVKNIEKAGLSNRITIILGDALQLEIEGSFDMMFIDAAKAQYIKFFERYDHNVRKGGYIISDNLRFHGLVENPEAIASRQLRQLVRKISNFIAYLKEREDYTTQFYELGDGVAVSEKNK